MTMPFFHSSLKDRTYRKLYNKNYVEKTHSVLWIRNYSVGSGSCFPCHSGSGSFKIRPSKYSTGTGTRQILRVHHRIAARLKKLPILRFPKDFLRNYWVIKHDSQIHKRIGIFLSNRSNQSWSRNYFSGTDPGQKVPDPHPQKQTISRTCGLAHRRGHLSSGAGFFFSHLLSITSKICFVQNSQEL